MVLIRATASDPDAANRWNISALPFITVQLGPAILIGAALVAARAAPALLTPRHRLRRRGRSAWPRSRSSSRWPPTAPGTPSAAPSAPSTRRAGPARSPAAEAPAAKPIAYDLDSYDTIGLYACQWFLPDTEIDLFHGDREAPPARASSSPAADWPRQPGCGAVEVWSAAGRDQVALAGLRDRQAGNAMESSPSATTPAPGAGCGPPRRPLYRTGYYLILGTGITGPAGRRLLGPGGPLLQRPRGRPERRRDLGDDPRLRGLLARALGGPGPLPADRRHRPAAAGRRQLRPDRRPLAPGRRRWSPLTSDVWSPTLGFLGEPDWLVGFTLATAAMTIFTLQDSVLTGLQTARWIPLENSLYAVAKLVLLVALAALLPTAGPFVAWNRRCCRRSSSSTT